MIFGRNVDLNKNELQNAVIHQSSAAPGSPAQGQVYYDTDDDNLYIWDGSGWVDLTVQGGGGATGPTGPAGATGPTGPAGVTGPTGPAWGGNELGYAQRTTDVSTTATALTDITGLSVTVTVGSRPIVVRCGFDAGISTAGFLGSVCLNADGTDVGIMCLFGNLNHSLQGQRRLTPAAGSHTYYLRTAQGSAGTLTLQMDTGASSTVDGPGWIQVLEV